MPRSAASRAARQGVEQPFVEQLGQRGAHRRARDTEPLDQRQLGHTLARRQFAADDQFAQAQLRLDRLRALGAAVERAGHRRHQAAGRIGTTRRSLATSASIRRRAHIAPASMFRL
jgi:hypothetical protein